MKSEFILHHSYESATTGEEETKLIGAYSSEENAQNAIERLSKQPGFRDLPEHFSIDEYLIGAAPWG